MVPSMVLSPFYWIALKGQDTTVGKCVLEPLHSGVTEVMRCNIMIYPYIKIMKCFIITFKASFDYIEGDA